jgi:hypothetical protein
VSLLPLNGKCYFAESKALIHSLRANRDLLISAPSYLVYLLVSLTSLPLSFPAKSIKVIYPIFFQVSIFLRLTYKIAWDLDEFSFIPVFPTTQLANPYQVSSIKLS